MTFIELVESRKKDTGKYSKAVSEKVEKAYFSILDAESVVKKSVKDAEKLFREARKADSGTLARAKAVLTRLKDLGDLLDKAGDECIELEPLISKLK